MKLLLLVLLLVTIFMKNAYAYEPSDLKEKEDEEQMAYLRSMK